jgi:molybdopterin-guanine dinucleotide biosynthesis protein MobB
MSEGMNQRSSDPATPPDPTTGTIPIVSIVGRSGSGKTTFIEKLIRELKTRGLRLAVIKHHYHPDFEFDVPGKDSYRLAQAGADHTVVAGPQKIVHVRQLGEEPSLGDVVADIDGVDLIITEGYKLADTPKIEVSRRGAGNAAAGDVSELVAPMGRLVAIVSDQRFDLPLPQFGLDDAQGVADLIEAQFLPAA